MECRGVNGLRSPKKLWVLETAADFFKKRAGKATGEGLIIQEPRPFVFAQNARNNLHFGGFTGAQVSSQRTGANLEHGGE
jgi:hypothetical protein